MNDINEEQEKKDIVKIFDEIDDALSLEDIVSELKESEHSDPGKVVLRAIQDKILYVEDIEDDETIYLALTRPGEKLWKSLCTTET